MTVRNMGQLVHAVNAAADLNNFVTYFIKEWKRLANGVNKINLNYDEFSVQVIKITESHVQVKIVISKTTSYEEPVYYDVDDDMFSENWGSDNTCGHVVKQHTNLKESYLDVPNKIFMMTKTELQTYLVNSKIDWDREQEEKQKQQEITALRRQLEKLVGKSV